MGDKKWEEKIGENKIKYNVFVCVHVCIECVSDVLKVSFDTFSCTLLGIKIFGLKFIELHRKIHHI